MTEWAFPPRSTLRMRNGVAKKVYLANEGHAEVMLKSHQRQHGGVKLTDCQACRELSERLEMAKKMSGWITYSRIHHSSRNEVIITRRSDEPPPHGGWSPRPATQEEIAAEIARRKELADLRAVNAAFESRQEYRDAKAIMSAIEHMTPENNPLDALRPEQWAKLRKKICGN